MILPILFAVVTRCGVTFHAPDGWRASVEKVDDAAIACRIDLDPPKWPDPKHSRWGGPKHPFKIEIYTPSTTYDEALAAAQRRGARLQHRRVSHRGEDRRPLDWHRV